MREIVPRASSSASTRSAGSWPVRSCWPLMALPDDPQVIGLDDSKKLRPLGVVPSWQSRLTKWLLVWAFKC